MKKGFSLIELLIVSIILLSIAGFSIATYGSFSDSQKLQQAGNTLENNLRFIQSRAISGFKPSNCDGNNSLISYRVTFSFSTYGYSPVCMNGIPPGSYFSFSLPDGVSFSLIPPPFDFQVLTGVSTRSVTIRLVSGSKQYGINIQPNGNIEDIGFIQ